LGENIISSKKIKVEIAFKETRLSIISLFVFPDCQ